MKAGDLVVITKGEPPYFAVGDKARLMYQEQDGDWWGNFNRLGNPHVRGDGLWCISEHGACEVVPSPLDYTVFALYEDDLQRYAEHVTATSAEEAEAKVLAENPDLLIAAVVLGVVEPVL